MQVEEEEPGARLLPRASQTAACDLTELLSQLCLAPVSGSAHDSCFGWRMPETGLLGKMIGEPAMLRTGKEAFTPWTYMAIRGLPGNPVFQVGT